MIYILRLLLFFSHNYQVKYRLELFERGRAHLVDVLRYVAEVFVVLLQLCFQWIQNWCFFELKNWKVEWQLIDYRILNLNCFLLDNLGWGIWLFLLQRLLWVLWFSFILTFADFWGALLIFGWLPFSQNPLLNVWSLYFFLVFLDLLCYLLLGLLGLLICLMLQ